MALRYPQLSLILRLVCVFSVVFGAVGLGAQPTSAAPTTYYVATTGNNNNDGLTPGTAFLTIQKCADVAQAGDTCVIRAGVYRETVTLPRSGSAGNPISFMPYNGEAVTISGADPVTGWTAHDLSGGKRIYRANMPWNLNARISTGIVEQNTNNQIFVDGAMMPEARWPNIPYTEVTRQSNAHQARTDSASNFQPHSVTYHDSDLSIFPTNFWQNAKINFSPGFKIEWTTCDVSGSTSSTLNVVCNPDPGAYNNRTTLDTAPGSFYLPGPQNPYYLWGKYEALDAPGEWFRNSSGTLYLWTPDGSDPSTRQVEARARLWAFDLRDRSYITLSGLRLFAAGINTSASSNNLLISSIESYYGWHFQEIPPLYLTMGTNGLIFRGSNNVIRDSLFAYAPGSLIRLSAPGQNAAANQLINNVLYEGGYMANQPAIDGQSAGGGSSHLVAQNTAWFTGNTLMHAAPGVNIRYNDFYQSHLQISDLGTIYTWNTDGLGAEIAYNYAHDNYGELDLDLQFYGGHGIYLDDNARNYVVHHNITWETTMPGIFTFGVTQAGYRRIYNNTVDGMLSFDAKPGQTLAGTEVRNNIATVTDLTDPNLTHSHNLTGDGLYVNRAARDYRLRNDSPALNAGMALPPYTDGFTGSAPDLGALEFNTPGFVAGALVREQDLTGLNVACTQDAPGTSATCTIANLPRGRKIPLDFQVKIGAAAPGQGCITTMNYTTHLGTAVCKNVPTGGQSGVQSISVQLPGGSLTNTGSTIDLGPLAVFSVSPSSGPAAGGSPVTIAGRRFISPISQSLYAVPVTINNGSGGNQYNYQVPVTLNTAALIAAGKMRSDCGDLRFNDAYQPLSYWIESGCNTSTTRVWVKVPVLLTGNNSITLSYGNPALTSASSGPETFVYFDDFEDGVLSSLIEITTQAGITVSETGGKMRINGTTNSGNQFASFGFYLKSWEIPMPPSFAVDSELTVMSGPSSFKASSGAWEMSLFGNFPKSIGYFSGSWQTLGTSTINTATPSDQRFSLGYTGPENSMTLRWFENGNFTSVLATRTNLNNPSRGVFVYGPDQVASFDARYDNVRIRTFAFPEPTASLGAETIASSRFTIGGATCGSIVVSSSTQATCITPPGSVGPATVTVINPDSSSANFNSFTYYGSTPPAPTLISPKDLAVTPLNPQYRWEEVAGAIAYTINVVDVAQSTLVINRLYGPETCSGGVCSVTPPETLSNNGLYAWYLAAAGSTWGPWSEPGVFIASVPPGRPTLLSPSGNFVPAPPTLQPQYQWTHTPGALLYYLVVYDLRASTLQFAQEFNLLTDPTLCQAGVCTVTPDAPGSALTNGGIYGMYVAGLSYAGPSPWSEGVLFGIYLLPDAPVQLAPSGTISTTRPFYQWTKVQGATDYAIQVFNQSGVLVLDQWVSSAAACATTPCQFQQPTSLPSGSYVWFMYAWNPAGFSPPTSGLIFTVPAGPPAAPTFRP